MVDTKGVLSTVNGIVFNLLEAVASEAGCSNEAWEVVTEFAAAEALLSIAAEPKRDLRGDVALTPQFEVPVEAVLRCFSDRSGEDVAMELDEQDLDAFDPYDLTHEILYDAFAGQPSSGFSASAFSELDRITSEAEADEFMRDFEHWRRGSRKF